jgi:hypothetical protein
VNDIFQSVIVDVRKGVGIVSVAYGVDIIIIVVEDFPAGIDDGVIVIIIIGVVIIIVIVIIIIPIRVSLTDGGGVDGIFDIISSISPTAVDVRCRWGWRIIRSDVRCRWDWKSSSTRYGWLSRS